jgi:hypothetical protein
MTNITKSNNAPVDYGGEAHLDSVRTNFQTQPEAAFTDEIVNYVADDNPARFRNRLVIVDDGAPFEDLEHLGARKVETAGRNEDADVEDGEEQEPIVDRAENRMDHVVALLRDIVHGEPFEMTAEEIATANAELAARGDQIEREETSSSRDNEQNLDSTNAADALSDTEVSRDDTECAVELTDGDLEAHLRRELIELDRRGRTAHTELEELLYRLHQVMAIKGRKGRFAAFLRDELAWTQNRPYDKAMRLIANHQLRVGLISKEEHAARYGNRRKKPTLRGDSKDAAAVQGVRPAMPHMVQVVNTVITDGPDREPTSPIYTLAEIAAQEKALDQSTRQSVTSAVWRVLMPAGLKGFFESAVRHQMRLHNTKTYQETVLKVFLCGTKSAGVEDEWGMVLEEIFKSIGENPDSACQADPTDHDPEWDPTASRNNANRNNASRSNDEEEDNHDACHN